MVAAVRSVREHLASLGPRGLVVRVLFETLKRVGFFELTDPAHMAESDREMITNIRSWAPGVPSATPEEVAQYFRTRSSPTFYPALVRDLPETLQRANEVIGGTLPLFQDRVTFEGQPQWLKDWRSGNAVAESHWSRISNSPEQGRVDARTIWELNRLHWLIPVAQALRLTGEEAYGTFIETTLKYWTEKNPYGHTINWTSGLEVAVRLHVFLWVFYSLVGWQKADPAAILRLFYSILEHAKYIHKHIAWTTELIANDHLLGEAAGLWLAGRLFPEVSQAAVWTKRGEEILSREARRQFSVNGAYFMRSWNYHRFALTWYGVCVSLGRLNSWQLPRPWEDLLERSAPVLLAAQGKEGFPNWGDEDSGSLFGGPPPDEVDFVAALSHLPGTGAGLTARWHGLPATPGLTAGTDHATASLLQPDGIYVIRAPGVRVDFVAQPLEQYGHADALHVGLVHKGERVLVDPGTRLYTLPAAERSWIRSTLAHNTVGVDGLDQAEQHRYFRWCSSIPTASRVVASDQQLTAVEATHLGYARVGVVHRRAVVLFNTGHLAVFDWLAGDAGLHRVTDSFQFGSGIELSTTPYGWLAQNHRVKVGVVLASQAPTAVSVGSAPVSTRYGESATGPRLEVNCTTPLPRCSLALFAPLSSGQELQLVTDHHARINDNQPAAGVSATDGIHQVSVGLSPGPDSASGCAFAILATPRGREVVAFGVGLIGISELGEFQVAEDRPLRLPAAVS